MLKPAALLLSLAFVLPVAGCDSEEEKQREAKAAEARRKAELSPAEHEKNCEKGDAQGCFALATAIQVGDYGEYDEAKIQSLFEKGCDLGHGKSCMDGADGYLGVDDAKAMPLLKKGCELKDDDACHRLEALEKKTADKPAEAEKAAEGDAPAEGEASAEGEAPAEGEKAAEGDKPAEGDEPADK
jgi:TPR repeat protein